jgi:ferrous iron transport protein B
MYKHRSRHQHKGQQGWKGYERVTLIGNPNVGKSVIFGILTGKYAIVSNYPGTTVEVSYANISLDGKKYLVVDTPGVNNLIPMSEDEKVTRDILLADKPSVVLQVGDSKNIKRTLLLTSQLAEMGLPVILDLNMEDEAGEIGINIDIERLRSLIAVEVVSTVAPERKGLRALKAAISKKDNKIPAIPIQYDHLIEEYIEKVSLYLREANISKRAVAIMILSGDESLREWLNINLEVEVIHELEKLRHECQERLKRPISVIINETRLKKAAEIADRVTKKIPQAGSSLASTLGRFSMHPVWGIPILLIVLFGLYEFVGVFGAGILVGLIENKIFDAYLIPIFVKVIKLVIPFPLAQEMFIGEYGLITMALKYAIGIILPLTTTFFIAFAILEDSGYLPRLAIMSNKVFNMLGLSGKAVLPMVLGLGCGTMAVMTTRILESRRERIIATFLLALAVPCAAQLGVIMGMLGALSAKAMSIWVLSILGVLLFSGYLASKIVPGEKPGFFLEIPPLRKPTLTNIAVKTSSRVIWYLKEAVPLFMLGTFILFVLSKLALLGLIRGFAAPVVVNILGLPEKTTESFIIGFLRRDYGAAGLFAMAQKGLLTPIQSVVSLVTITLFIPCLAHFFMLIKERGIKMALSMAVIIFPMAIFFGGLLNWVLMHFHISI